MHFSVISKKFCKLFDKEFIISWRIAVAFRITVPRRQVYTKLQPIFFTGFTQFIHDVSLSIFPWRRSNRVLRCFSRPQAKTIMVFSCQNSHLETSGFQIRHPLVAIQFFRIKQFRVFFTTPPFMSGKGIDSEV